MTEDLTACRAEATRHGTRVVPPGPDTLVSDRQVRVSTPQKMILGSRCVLAGGEIGVAAEVLHQSALIQIVQNTHSVTTHSPVLSHDGLVSFSCYRMTMLRPMVGAIQ